MNDPAFPDFTLALAGCEPAPLARKRGAHNPLEYTVVRPLCEADLPALSSPPESTSPQQRLKTITYQHHQLAQALARGASDVEVSLLTGYVPTYISLLKTDPQFKELLAYYSTKTEEIYVDAVERLKAVGLTALEKLADRLEREEDFTNRELMELTDMALVKPVTNGMKFGQQIGPGGTPGVSVSVSFISAQPSSGESSGKVIEHEK